MTGQNCSEAQMGEHLDFQNFGEVSHAVCGLRHNQRSMADVIEDMQRRHEDHASQVAALKAAFPGGDTGAHLRYHESLIERNAELRRLRVAIQEKTISGLIWAGLVGLGAILWNAFKASVFR